MTQGFEQLLTYFPPAQSVKGLPTQGFCLYDVAESSGMISENGMLLPIRATEPRKVNRVSISGACGSNFYESLSGIETTEFITDVTAFYVPISTNPYQGLKLKNYKTSCCLHLFQFLRIPIRD